MELRVFFRNLDLEIEEEVKGLNKLDKLVALEDVPDSSDTVEKRVQAQSLLWKKLHYR